MPCVDWSVPKEWAGETCFILGGGASLEGFNPEVLRGHGRIIAIKEAGLTMCPWADVLYWADKHWCDGDARMPAQAARLHLHTGKYKVSRTHCDKTGPHDVKVLRVKPHKSFTHDSSEICGPDSGSNAINLAALFGAKRIVLLGFDMRGVNWDGRARKAHNDGSYKSRFMPALAKMAAPLQKMGVEVLNASPRTALGCFPLVKLEDVLARKPRGRQKAADADAFAAPEEYEGGDGDAPEDVMEMQEGETVLPDTAPDAEQEDLRDARLVPDDGVIEHYGLEMHEPGRELWRAISALGANEHCFINIRLPAADVVTRRNSHWWRLQLTRSFASIIEHPAPAGMVRFECRKTPA